MQNLHHISQWIIYRLMEIDMLFKIVEATGRTWLLDRLATVQRRRVIGCNRV